MLKRITALVLALFFGLFSLEVAVADVHDGDASAAEVAKAPIGGGLASAATGKAPSSDSNPTAPQPSGHNAHACHCIHLHGGWAPGPDPFPSPPAVTQAVLAHGLLEASQVNVDVHLRPPIA